MKLAIVGSRSLWSSKEASLILCQQLELQQPSLVISGGAIGIDKMAEWIASKVYRVPTRIFLPAAEHPTYYLARDRQIAEACERLLLVEGKGSKTHGARYTANLARKLGKSVIEFVVEEG